MSGRVEIKHLPAPRLIIAIAFLFAACTGGNNSGGRVDSAGKTVAPGGVVSKDPAPARSVAKVSDADAKFAADAAGDELAEVALGKLALQKAGIVRVRTFGTKMISDHSKVVDRLTELAGRKNIRLPATTGRSAQQEINDLSEKSGFDFDFAYIAAMTTLQQQTIDRFQDAATTLQDPQLKALAEKTLPLLQKNLAEIKAINMGLKGQ